MDYKPIPNGDRGRGAELEKLATSFIAGPSGDGGTPKPEKKKEPAEANHKEEAKKEHKESSSEKTPKESQTEPKKKLL